MKYKYIIGLINNTEDHINTKDQKCTHFITVGPHDQLQEDHFILLVFDSN